MEPEMVQTDLVVLVGVGILALGCLVVCGLYVYRCSDGYRSRNRKRRLVVQINRRQVSRRIGEPYSGVEAAIAMGTQLSLRCKTSLYRVIFGHDGEESVVFLMAASPEAAQKEAIDALAAIHCIAPDDVHLYSLASFRELIDRGTSEDEDLRVFEVAWQGPNVSAWAEHPLFLTDDSSLLGKWAELYADLARELATSVIERARH
jgi:hypothetical protein